jgi:hypothetical protein
VFSKTKIKIKMTKDEIVAKIKKVFSRGAPVQADSLNSTLREIVEYLSNLGHIPTNTASTILNSDSSNDLSFRNVNDVLLDEDTITIKGLFSEITKTIADKQVIKNEYTLGFGKINGLVIGNVDGDISADEDSIFFILTDFTESGGDLGFSYGYDNQTTGQKNLVTGDKIAFNLDISDGTGSPNTQVVLVGTKRGFQFSNDPGTPSTAAATLDVIGDLKFVTGNQGDNKVLASSSTGVADWVSPYAHLDSLSTFADDAAAGTSVKYYFKTSTAALTKNATYIP